MLITVLIPTRNRPIDVKNTINNFLSIIESQALKEYVEVVCVDNSTNNSTYAAISEITTNPAFKYFRQDRISETAETSLFNSIRFAKGKYVWCFGDDDSPKANSLKTLLQIIQSSEPSYVLLNTDIFIPQENRTLTYLPISKDEVYGTGLDLFKNYGLVSATTTISCLFFKREEFRVDLALELAGRSQVYSHSAACLICFFSKPARVLAQPILTYRQNTFTEEKERFDNFCQAKDIIPESIFTEGLARLIETIHDETKISFADICTFRELELRKDNWQLSLNITGRFILSFATQAAVQRRPKWTTESKQLNSLLKKIGSLFWRAGMYRNAAFVFSMKIITHFVIHSSAFNFDIMSLKKLNNRLLKAFRRGSEIYIDHFS
jgi:glycosyltransferase involved in cell wall biosynthesis